MQAVISFAAVAGLLTLVPGTDTSLVLRGVLSVLIGFGVKLAAVPS